MTSPTHTAVFRDGQIPTHWNTGRYVIAGWLVIVAIFGGLGLWGALVPLSGAVIASGTVTVESTRKSIQHLEGGIVSGIFVRNGDLVSKGQPLLALQQTQADASFSLVLGKLDSLLARRARLDAERNNHAVLRFPPWLLKAMNDPTNREILRGQKELFAVRKQAIDGEALLLQKRIELFRSDIAGLKIQVKSLDRRMWLVGEELAAVRQLYSKGYPGNRAQTTDRRSLFPNHQPDSRRVARRDLERNQH